MMVEALLRTKPKETEAELAALVEEFVMALNGQPAIFQMVRFVKEMKSRGGEPDLPAKYLREYNSRLLRSGRRNGARNPRTSGTTRTLGRPRQSMACWTSCATAASSSISPAAARAPCPLRGRFAGSEPVLWPRDQRSGR